MTLTWSLLSSTPEKMNAVPIRTPTIDPIGLKACEKFSRLSELTGSPSWAMNGLAPVSRNDKPLAITNSAARKKPYRPMIAAGQNRMLPVL